MCANLLLIHTPERNGHEFDFIGVVDCAAKNVSILEFERAVIGVVTTQVRVDRLDDDARKFLAFTDNRQDASLQAGHFNDFVLIEPPTAGVY